MFMNFILCVNYICNNLENVKKLLMKNNCFKDRCFKYSDFKRKDIYCFYDFLNFFYIFQNSISSSNIVRVYFIEIGFNVFLKFEFVNMYIYL